VRTPLDPELKRLLDARLAAGADHDAIDEQIWARFGEAWCVMATDLSGFSRGVAQFGIVHFLQTIYESERILLPVLAHHRGTLLKVEGDSFLAIFADVEDALDAAAEMQAATREYNQHKRSEEQLLLGVGLGFGRVLRVAESEVYGNEVNSACILGETYAKGYEILVTHAVRERAGSRWTFEAFPNVPPGAGAAYRVRTES
jgi:adenylate cyclase